MRPQNLSSTSKYLANLKHLKQKKDSRDGKQNLNCYSNIRITLRKKASHRKCDLLYTTAEDVVKTEHKDVDVTSSRAHTHVATRDLEGLRADKMHKLYTKAENVT